jgi:cyanate permease
MADRRGAEDKHLHVAILWAGTFLVALGIVGFLLDPRLAFIWLIFLLFGIATAPQSLSMAITNRRRRAKRSDSMTEHQPKQKGTTRERQ